MGTDIHCLTGGETQLVEEPCSARPFSSGWVGDSVRVCGWGGHFYVAARVVCLILFKE